MREKSLCLASPDADIEAQGQVGLHFGFREGCTVHPGFERAGIEAKIDFRTRWALPAGYPCEHGDRYARVQAYLQAGGSVSNNAIATIIAAGTSPHADRSEWSSAAIDRRCAIDFGLTVLGVDLCPSVKTSTATAIDLSHRVRT